MWGLEQRNHKSELEIRRLFGVSDRLPRITKMTGMNGFRWLLGSRPPIQSGSIGSSPHFVAIVPYLVAIVYLSTFVRYSDFLTFSHIPQALHFPHFAHDHVGPKLNKVVAFSDLRWGTPVVEVSVRQQFTNSWLRKGIVCWIWLPAKRRQRISMC